MSLYDIFLQRAAQEHQNELNSDTGGIILASLAHGVMQGVQQEQAALKKQKEDDRVAEKQMERFNRIIKSQKDLPAGTRIKTSIDKEGNPSFSISQADDEEDAYKKESLQIRRDNLEQKIVEEKRRVLTQKLNNAKTIGGIIPADDMQVLNEEVGFDLGTDLSSGRVEPTPEGSFRILSADEFAKKSTVMKEQSDKESVLNIVEGDIQQIYDAFDKITPNLKGPIEGRVKAPIQGWLGNTGVRVFDDIKDGFLSNLSRFVGQTGVLTDKDLDLVRGWMPKVEDTEDIKTSKRAELTKLMNRKRQELKRRMETSIGKISSGSNTLTSGDHSSLWNMGLRND